MSGALLLTRKNFVLTLSVDKHNFCNIGIFNIDCKTLFGITERCGEIIF
jgi:hypothetical protein